MQTVTEEDFWKRTFNRRTSGSGFPKRVTTPSTPDTALTDVDRFHGVPHPSGDDVDTALHGHPDMAASIGPVGRLDVSDRFD